MFWWVFHRGSSLVHPPIGTHLPPSKQFRAPPAARDPFGPYGRRYAWSLSLSGSFCCWWTLHVLDGLGCLLNRNVFKSSYVSWSNCRCWTVHPPVVGWCNHHCCLKTTMFLLSSLRSTHHSQNRPAPKFTAILPSLRYRTPPQMSPFRNQNDALGWNSREFSGKNGIELLNQQISGFVRPYVKIKASMKKTNGSWGGTVVWKTSSYTSCESDATNEAFNWLVISTPRKIGKS